ncbi:MAG: formate dehydrogenase [Curvibacter sp.]|jgi:hypothetical protein|nr:formate dehydrogenase [Curvibacter sp.]
MSQPQGKLSRRTVFAGAGTAGAMAAVASMMPTAKPAEQVTRELKPAPKRGGGYQLSEHVKHYYQTTRL